MCRSEQRFRYLLRSWWGTADVGNILSVPETHQALAKTVQSRKARPFYIVVIPQSSETPATLHYCPLPPLSLPNKLLERRRDRTFPPCLSIPFFLHLLIALKRKMHRFHGVRFIRLVQPPAQDREQGDGKRGRNP
jgi:hypothetical protein